MAKKKHAKKSPALLQGTPAKRKVKWPALPRVMLFVRPVLFVLAVGLLFVHNKGYTRLYEMNFVRLQDHLERYQGLTYQEKLRRFFPQSFPLFDMILKETPPEAVILIPPREIWYPKNKKLGLGQWMNRKDYLTYFLYPRRVITDTKTDASSPLMTEVTHVLVVDGWGYDKVPYKVSNPRAFAVLPLKR